MNCKKKKKITNVCDYYEMSKISSNVRAIDFYLLNLSYVGKSYCRDLRAGWTVLNEVPIFGNGFFPDVDLYIFTLCSNVVQFYTMKSLIYVWNIVLTLQNNSLKMQCVGLPVQKKNYN